MPTGNEEHTKKEALPDFFDASFYVNREMLTLLVMCPKFDVHFFLLLKQSTNQKGLC